MKQRNVMMAIGLLLGISWVPAIHAEEVVAGGSQQREVQKLELTSGKSMVLDLPVAIKRASLANPEVADTVVGMKRDGRDNPLERIEMTVSISD